MAIKKDNGRQYPLIAKVAFAYSDLVSGVAAEAIDLPPNATIIGGELVIETAFNSATTSVIDVGDGADPNRYTASSVNVKVAGRTALTLTGYRYTGKDTIDILWAETGAAATQGSG